MNNNLQNTIAILFTLTLNISLFFGVIYYWEFIEKAQVLVVFFVLLMTFFLLRLVRRLTQAIE